MNDVLQYKDYIGSVHFSTEDDIFYGRILGIDDLVSFEGASVTALKKSFHEAVDDYLETCAAVGKEPNKTYKGTFNVRIPTELHKRAAIFASLSNISLNDFIKTAIDFTLSHKQSKEKRSHGRLDR